MKALGVVIVAVALLISAPTDGVAQESLSGNWDLTVQTDQGDQVFTVVLVEEGEDLTATGEIPEFGPIEMSGTRDGAEIRLQWELDFDGTPIDITFMGTVADDGTMSGTADFGGLGGGGWSAKRTES